MNIYTVKNSEGDTAQVEEDKLNHAIKDGYIPVVSNGREEVRTLPENFQKAAADGYSPVITKPEPTKTESFVRGGAQGLSLGFADELTGALGAVSDVAGDKYQLADLLERYKTQRDESREAYRKAEEANPLTSMAGNIVGGAATALVPGLGGATLANALKIGAVTGLGASEGDTLGEQAKSAALGAGLGVAGYGAGKALGAASNVLKTSEVGKNFMSSLGVSEKYGVNLAIPQQAENFAGEAYGPIGEKEIKEVLKNKVGEILNPLEEFGKANAIAKRKIIDEAEASAARSSDEFSKDVIKILQDKYNVTGFQRQTDPDYPLLEAFAKTIKSPEFIATDELGNITTKAGDIKANARMYDQLRIAANDIYENAKTSTGKQAAAEIGRLARQYTRDSVDELAKARLPKIDRAIEVAKNVDKLMGLADAKKIGTSVSDESKIAGLFDKLESASTSGLTSQLKLDSMYKQLKSVNPELAEKLRKEIIETSELSSVIKANQVKGFNLNFINKSAPVKLGSAIGSNKMYQDVKKLATKSADYYNKVADSLIGKENNQALSNIFRKMATADNNTRNALLFGAYQNPTFRETMNELASSED